MRCFSFQACDCRVVVLMYRVMWSVQFKIQHYYSACKLMLSPSEKSQFTIVLIGVFFAGLVHSCFGSLVACVGAANWFKFAAPAGSDKSVLMEQKRMNQVKCEPTVPHSLSAATVKKMQMEHCQAEFAIIAQFIIFGSYCRLGRGFRNNMALPWQLSWSDNLRNCATIFQAVEAGTNRKGQKSG